MSVQRWTGIMTAHANGGFVAVGDYSNLTAELERLRAQLTASEASRKELRKALEKIRHGTNDDIPDRYRINAQDAYRIADEALANDAEQKGGGANG